MRRARKLTVIVKPAAQITVIFNALTASGGSTWERRESVSDATTIAKCALLKAVTLVSMGSTLIIPPRIAKNAVSTTAINVSHLIHVSDALIICFTIHLPKDARRDLIRCSEDCLTCSYTEDNCTECPLTHYLFVTKVDPEFDEAGDQAPPSVQDAFRSMQTSFSNKTKGRCVKTCPLKFGSKRVITNESQKKCLITESLSKMLIPTPAVLYPRDFYNAVLKLKVKYDKSIIATREVITQNDNSSYHEACNNRGERKTIENGLYGQISFCRCSNEFEGVNCEIPLMIVETYQNYLDNLIAKFEVSHIKKDNKYRQKFFNSLILINKFKLNLPLIKKLHNLIKSISKHDKIMENRKKLYHILDQLLSNLMNLVHTEKHKADSVINLDSDSITYLSELYEETAKVLETLEEAFEDINFNNSFLKFDMKHYLTLDTSTYYMAEYRYSDYLADRGFFILNPVLDEFMRRKDTANMVYFDFTLGYSKRDANESSAYYLQMLNMVTPLFENKLESANIKCLSNLMYLRNIDPDAPHKEISNTQVNITNVRMKLALYSIPIEDEISTAIECIAYNFTTNHTITGYVDSVIDGDDDGTIFAVCLYKEIVNFKSYYFMAIMKRNN